MEPEFEAMLALGFRILTEGPQQVLLLRTEDGSIHDVSLLHIREGDHSEEASLLKEIAGSVVTHIVVLWDDATVDVPSPGFRQQLLTVSPGSANALVLLQTGSGQLPLPLSILP